MGLGVAGDSANIKTELEAALTLSDRLQHPLTLLFAQGVTSHALYFTRDPEACQASAEKLMRHSTKYDLPVYGAIGSFWLGATDAMRGDPAGGLRQMEPAFDPRTASDSMLRYPAW